MEFQRVIEGRRSIRKFEDKDVEDDKIKRIVENVKWTPSAHNNQEWEIFVVKDDETKKKLAKAALHQDFVEQAPVVFVVCGDKNRCRENEMHYLFMDIGMVCYNICLTAYDLGLGSCIVGAFYPGEVSEILDLPENLIPLSLVPVGYPAEDPKPPRRRTDYAHWIK